MLAKLYSKLKKKFDKVFKKGVYSREAAKAGYQQCFFWILDKGSLSQTEIDAVSTMSERYFQKFVVKKDKVTLDSKELKDYIWTIVNSGADVPTSSAIIAHLRGKYFPVSNTIH